MTGSPLGPLGYVAASASEIESWLTLEQPDGDDLLMSARQQRVVSLVGERLDAIGHEASQTFASALSELRMRQAQAARTLVALASALAGLTGYAVTRGAVLRQSYWRPVHRDFADVDIGVHGAAVQAKVGERLLEHDWRASACGASFLKEGHLDVDLIRVPKLYQGDPLTGPDWTLPAASPEWCLAMIVASAAERGYLRQRDVNDAFVLCAPGQQHGYLT